MSNEGTGSSKVRRERAPVSDRTSLTKDEVSAWQAETRVSRTLSFIRNKYGIDDDQVDADINELAKNLPAVRHAIRDTVDADDAQSVLLVVQKRRAILAQRYVAVLGACEQARSFRDILKQWLYRKREIQEQRNDKLREACMSQVLLPVIRFVDRQQAQLKQMETLQWALKGNQEAVIAQIRIWTTQIRDP